MSRAAPVGPPGARRVDPVPQAVERDPGHRRQPAVGDDAGTRPKVRVLFTQARTDLTAVTFVHCMVMRHLDRRSVEVHLACNPPSGPGTPAQLAEFEAIPDLHLRLTNFGSSIFSRLGPGSVKNLVTAAASLLGLAVYARRHGIDVVHAPKKNRDIFVGVLLARLAGARCVIHAHEKCKDGDRSGPLALGRLQRWFVRRADGVIACSRFVADTALAWSGCEPSRVHPVLNALDAGRWDFEADGSAVRRELGIGPEAPVVASIARLDRQKGPERTIRALALLRGEAPEVRLLLVGGDDPFDPGYTGYLKSLVRDLGLADRVVFTGPRSDVQEILAACDVFAMPSHDEGLGLSLLEAMAMKRPTIALESGGPREVVEHGRTGLLSPPDDVGQLAENILTLVRDPALRRRMGEQGRARVEQRFTPRRMAAEIERVYRCLLEA